jgi:hypothetical protein
METDSIDGRAGSYSSCIVNGIFFSVLGLELRAYTLNHSTSSFCEGFFSR